MKKIMLLLIFTMVLPMIVPSNLPPLTGGIKGGCPFSISNLFSLSAKTLTIQPKKVKRRQGQNVYDIYYDLQKGIYKWVYLYYSTDMKHYKRAKGARGDVGKDVRGGKDKHIIWNAEVDFPTEYDGDIDVVVKVEKIPIPISSGMEVIGKNSKGYYEVKNLKDGSILIYIPAGEFTMGSENGRSDEKPVHKVHLDGYYIGKYEMTVAQFRKFVEATGYKTDAEKSGGGWVYVNGSWVQKSDANWRNPYFFSQTDNDPVVLVSWNDAVAYCRWAGLRLPTEAEWEKAARGGEDYKYAGSNNPDEVAWYDNNSGGHTHPVGEKKPNGYGIYDMSGNVWEWCKDWHGEHYYENSPYRNPRGPDSGSCRVNRGGSWFCGARFIRCANRVGDSPDDGYYSLGFRVAR